MIQKMAKKLKRLGEQLTQKNTHLNSSYKKNEELKNQINDLKTKL